MIEYCVTKVKLLQVNGVRPIMVFDGARLPMKRRIEDERKRQRLESRKAAEELLEAGDLLKANRKFNEAVEIDFLMKYRLI
jgi:exonuclease-1